MAVYRYDAPMEVGDGVEVTVAVMGYDETDLPLLCHCEEFPGMCRPKRVVYRLNG